MPRCCRCKSHEGQNQALVALLQEQLRNMVCAFKFDGSAGSVEMSQSPESKLHAYIRNINIDIDIILMRVISGTTQNFLRRRRKTPNTI